MILKFPPKRIVVAADTSSPAFSALEAAKILANRWHSKIEVVYARDIPVNLMSWGVEADGEGLGELAEQLEDLRRWREERLELRMKEMPSSRVKIRSVRGWPPKALAALAIPGRADWVVTGTHGYSGLRRLAFGSVSEAIVRAAHVPVLTLHARRKPFRLSRILAPYNFKDYSRSTLLYAARMARLARARLDILYVAPEGSPREKAAGELNAELRKLFGRIGFTGYRALVRKGNPRREILQAGAGGDYDLIVVAAHRRWFWRDVILGSTAETILRHSPIPVLSIPSVEKGGGRRREPAELSGTED
jgi:nucleotide-binding universal stress UspA family protein